MPQHRPPLFGRDRPQKDTFYRNLSFLETRLQCHVVTPKESDDFGGRESSTRGVSRGRRNASRLHLIAACVLDQNDEIVNPTRLQQ
jgi:hypothetical protein